MTCEDCQELVVESFGLSELPADCLEHLQSCTACGLFRAELETLRHRFGDESLFGLTERESVHFLDSLSSTIDSPHVTDIRPRFSFRRFMVAAAVLLVVGAGGLSVWYTSDSERAEWGMVHLDSASDSLLAFAVDLPDDTLGLSDRDVQILLRDLSQSRGFEATESLLDDLTEDEMKYLEKNLNTGDIL